MKMKVESLEQSVPELFRVANKKYLKPEQAIEIIKTLMKNGNGVISSTDIVSVEAIQLQSLADIDDTLYFDMVVERPAFKMLYPFTLAAKIPGYQYVM